MTVNLPVTYLPAQAAIHGEMDSETDLDDTVGESEDEDLLLQQAGGRMQSKSR